MTAKQFLLSFWPDFTGLTTILIGLILVSDAGPDTGALIMLLLPVFSIPVALWQVLRVFRSSVSATEIALAYIVSTAVILWIVVLCSFAISLVGVIGVLMVIPPGATIIANVWLLRRNLKAEVPPEVSAGTFLIGSYLSHAVLFLFAGSWTEIVHYFLIATYVGYVLRIIQLTRLGAEAYRPPRGQHTCLGKQ